MALLERSHQLWEIQALEHVEKMGREMGLARVDLANKTSIVIHTSEGDERVYIWGSSLIAQTFIRAYREGRRAA